MLINDFNIDLLRMERVEYNNLSSHVFAPYEMQPTRLIANTLIR